MNRSRYITPMTSLVALFLMAMLQQAAPCESLRTLNLPNTTITTAELVPAGPFTQPAPQGGTGRAGPGARRRKPAVVARPAAAAVVAAPAAPGSRLPAHCRLPRCSQPSADSHIEMEVVAAGRELERQVPGRRQRRLGGHHQLSPRWRPRCRKATRRRRPTPVTRAATRSFAIDHPEKLIDFAYRAVHEMTVQSKAIIAAYYNRAPRLSYWNGCSTGGRQGLMSAQRYPGGLRRASSPARRRTTRRTCTPGISSVDGPGAEESRRRRCRRRSCRW